MDIAWPLFISVGTPSRIPLQCGKWVAANAGFCGDGCCLYPANRLDEVTRCNGASGHWSGLRDIAPVERCRSG